MSSFIGLFALGALLQELPEKPSIRMLYERSELVLCGEVLRLSDEFDVPSNELAYQFVFFKIIKIYKGRGGEHLFGEIIYRDDECTDSLIPAVMVLVQKHSSWTERFIPSYCLHKRYALFLRQEISMDGIFVRSKIDSLWPEQPWEEVAEEVEKISKQERRQATSQPASRPSTATSAPAPGVKD